MSDSFTNEFIDLNEFSKHENIISYNSYEITKKDSNIKCFYKQSKKKINEFNRSQIISLSQEVNTLLKVTHPSIIKFIGYNPINYSK